MATCPPQFFALRSAGNWLKKIDWMTWLETGIGMNFNYAINTRMKKSKICLQNYTKRLSMFASWTIIITQLPTSERRQTYRTRIFSFSCAVRSIHDVTTTRYFFSKLRNPLKYPIPYPRIIKYQPFLNYALANCIWFVFYCTIYYFSIVNYLFCCCCCCCCCCVSASRLSSVIVSSLRLSGLAGIGGWVGLASVMSVCVRSVGPGAANGVLVLGLTTICCPVLLLKV